MQGFAADPDYWKGEVFAYVGLLQNFKDLKDHCVSRAGPRVFTRVPAPRVLTPALTLPVQRWGRIFLRSTWGLGGRP